MNRSSKDACVSGETQAELRDNVEPIDAWEQIEDGRYMPRRVRGSCLGRELG